MANWIKRELIGTFQLDELNGGGKAILKAFRKHWPDGSSCLDIMKYIQLEEKEQCFYPTQHIQIPWELAYPFLPLFKEVEP